MTWYHGSPFVLTTIRPGSSITANLPLARAFSHKPTLLTLDDDGRVKHDGTLPGYLYCVAEEVRPEDIRPHPRSSMPAGEEWLTTRELSLRLIGPVEIGDEEKLSEKEIAWCRRKLAARDEPA